MLEAKCSLQRQLPHGLTDLFLEPAAAKTLLEGSLRETFQRWGYRRIIPPTFEYADSLSTEASPDLIEQMYRFFDREGTMLSLRPDMTVPTARVVGTKLYDQPLPLRFYYVGNVFRHVEPQAGRRREFTQAGVELVGAGTPDADAEVIAVAIDALQRMDIADFQINLGQVTFLQAILEEAGLSNGALRRLEQAIDRKNDVELANLVAELGIRGAVATAICALPHLCGGVDVLAEARSLSTNHQAEKALDHLAAVYDILGLEGVVDHVILDLGEVRRMDYYTGISFVGYVAGLGFPICNGGRYDRLLAHFGRDLPAVGFALGVERALLVTQARVDLGPDLVVQACGDASCRDIARLARSQGLRVEIDVLQRDWATLVDEGRIRGVTGIVACHGPAEFLLAQGESTRLLTRDELKKELSSWTR